MRPGTVGRVLRRGAFSTGARGVHFQPALTSRQSGVRFAHRGQVVARYPRSYLAGIWQPAPRMRPEPPQVAPVIPIAAPEVVPPALSDYAELCA